MAKNISINDEAQKLLDVMKGGSYSDKICKLWRFAQQGSTLWELEVEASFNDVIKLLKAEDAPKDIVQQVGFLGILISDKRYFGSDTAKGVSAALREAALKKIL